MSITRSHKARVRVGGGLALLLMLSLLLVPGIVAASNANRVFYAPDPASFVPEGSFGSMVAEGYGKGINKLTVNAGPEAYDLFFTINNTNQSGRAGTTFFETRKGPGNNDLSSFVALSATPDFAENATNTVTMDFPGSAGAPLYVRVHVPACGSDGTFRIQAHPGGTDKQGNGPGVVVYVNCNGFVPAPPPPPPPPPTICYSGTC